MASSLMHLAIAKKVLDYTYVRNTKDYFLGSIAPDISRQIGDSKEKSHFSINSINEDTPNLELFIKRYPNFKNTAFDLGYFTHLYADKVWNEEFLPKITTSHSIQLLDGTVQEMSEEEITRLLYSDYTSLTSQIIDAYELDLSLFYEEFQKPTTDMIEVPVDQLDLLLNKMGIIIQNAQGEKSYTIDFQEVKDYIDDTSKRIIEELKKH